MKRRSIVGGVSVLLVTAGLLTAPALGSAQTQVQQRRADRLEARDGNQVGRDDARAGKAACLAGDEKTRPECRKEKRDANAGADDAGQDDKNGE